jgi:hypothetical protein
MSAEFSISLGGGENQIETLQSSYWSWFLTTIIKERSDHVLSTSVAGPVDFCPDWEPNFLERLDTDSGLKEL